MRKRIVDATNPPHVEKENQSANGVGFKMCTRHCWLTRAKGLRPRRYTAMSKETTTNSILQITITGVTLDNIFVDTLITESTYAYICVIM